MKNQHSELIADIKKSIDELINGVQYEDEFYGRILDKIVVNDKNHIDVYLNMLPYKWNYAVSSGAEVAISAKDVPTERLNHGADLRI